MTCPPLPCCSVLILAGGRGQRMGGRDKGLLAWKGEPLVAHVQRVVRPLSDDLVISCNRNQAAYRAYADQLVGDADPDFPGPLAGVIAGLTAAFAISSALVEQRRTGRGQRHHCSCRFCGRIRARWLGQTARGF